MLSWKSPVIIHTVRFFYSLVRSSFASLCYEINTSDHSGKKRLLILVCVLSQVLLSMAGLQFPCWLIFNEFACCFIKPSIVLLTYNQISEQLQQNSRTSPTKICYSDTDALLFCSTAICYSCSAILWFC